jgi:hypothetical protein
MLVTFCLLTLEKLEIKTIILPAGFVGVKCGIVGPASKKGTGTTSVWIEIAMKNTWTCKSQHTHA